MRRRTFIYAVLICLQCITSQMADAQTIRQPGDTSSINGSWVLIPVLASDTATGKIPTIRFNLIQKTFSGFTGCNQMSGSFSLRGNQLSFNHRLRTTKMSCEGYNEKAFIDNLLRVTAYKIDDGMLILLDKQTPLSKWTRKPTDIITALR